MKRFMIIFVTSLMMLFALPSTASAAPPERRVSEVDVSFVSSCPGFDLAVATSGALRYKTFSDRHGNEIRSTIHVDLTSIQSRADGTGETLEVTLRYMTTSDLVTGERTVSGLISRVDSSDGTVYREVGRQVFNDANELVSSSGQTEELRLFDFACTRLA